MANGLKIMTDKTNITHNQKVILLVLAIFIAYMCRMCDSKDAVFKLAGYLRTYIYITIFYLWGRSIKRRIIQKQVQRYLISIVGLMIFWIMVRTIKYFIVDSINVSRYLWYMYYIPLLAIPFLGLLTAMSLGKAEDYKLPEWTRVLYIPTIVSIVFVLTNDFHQKMFTFPKNGSIWSDLDYNYACGYGIVMIWCIGCAISALVIIVIKSKVPNTRKIMWRPILPLILLFIYMGLYVAEIGILRTILGDMTVFCCLFFTAIFESCIQCGLIQSNSGYDKLFGISTIEAKIVNSDGDVCYKSDNNDNEHCKPDNSICYNEGNKITNNGNEYYKSDNNIRYNRDNIDLKDLLNTNEIITDSGIRFSKAPIKGGYIIWQEDIKKLLDLKNILAKNRDELESNKKALQDGYYVNKRLKELTEHNRLYNIAHNQVKKQLDKISGLISEYYKIISKDNIQAEISEIKSLENNKDKSNTIEISIKTDAEKKILGQMMVLGAYVKRRCNLLLLADKNENIPAKELELCFQESARNLSLYGIECSVADRIKCEISATIGGQLYDIFEEIVEKTLDSLETIAVWIDKNDDKIIMNITLESSVEQLNINSYGKSDKGLCEVRTCRDEDMWIIKTIVTGVKSCD